MADISSASRAGVAPAPAAAVTETATDKPRRNRRRDREFTDPPADSAIDRNSADRDDRECIGLSQSEAEQRERTADDSATEPLPADMLIAHAIANLTYRLRISDVPALACQITNSAGAEMQTERQLIEAEIYRTVGRSLTDQGNYLAGRVAAGGYYSQAEVAAALGVSRQAVHQLVNRYAASSSPTV